ncbi:hypothetical protein [Marinibactrum halimedae]|uniref:Phosphoribosyl-AMP cyclohydrolase n=1 Tax=Marinibactrum halimedae TaxID=1444977 RepID=A0AA37T3Y8_9GAMM|nr:hypothetical protein [Marinibactrum halimedae]MCD9459704.1 hypothetical protein [Marinibactrum halimedae]GLS24538.1 phosphoribosyl-AMP cyclohydrolase [Marinibactrum halimedae]
MNIGQYILVAFLFTVFSSVASAGITPESIVAAQERWGKGIVEIGKAKINGGNYELLATQHINTLYDYQEGTVLFKPTKAKNDQFRETFDEAHSYFVTGVVPEDDGFAIAPWTAVRFENHEMLIEGRLAMVMGNYFFETLNGEEVKVEYTFGYRLDDNDDLKIVLHHSSLPFSNQ